MVKIKRYFNTKWEKGRVQRVIKHYNKNYGTHLRIKGRSEDVYPDLKGQLNWDWVCYDTRTKDEIAVEVKRLTDPQIEQKSRIIWQILTEVQNRTNKARILPGTYLLSSEINFNKALLFKEKGDKTELKDTMFKVICESAKSMKQGEEKLLTPLIKQRLSYQLPDLTSLTLYKISAEDSLVIKGSGITGFGSIEFDANELNEFQKLVAHANDQLGKANPRKTLLVIIEEGFRHKDPVVIKEAFSKIKPACYSNTNNVYFVRGKKVVEILLPKLIMEKVQ